ncbi:MAG: hypothetical protein VX335_04185 [Pseudomonadota bacterium]|nr:hypothetical protein [Pseudomonadota bacterium]
MLFTPTQYIVFFLAALNPTKYLKLLSYKQSECTNSVYVKKISIALISLLSFIAIIVFFSSKFFSVSERSIALLTCGFILLSSSLKMLLSDKHHDYLDDVISNNSRLSMIPYLFPILINIELCCALFCLNSGVHDILAQTHNFLISLSAVFIVILILIKPERVLSFASDYGTLLLSKFYAFIVSFFALRVIISSLQIVLKTL